MNSMFSPSLLSMNIIVSDAACTRTRTQIRFPRSKRKRIQKSWRKDPSNWKEEVTRAIYQLADGSFVMDQVSYYELQRELDKTPLPSSGSYNSMSDSFFSDLRSMLEPRKPVPPFRASFPPQPVSYAGVSFPLSFKW